MYDAAGRVESVVDARNNRTTYLYDNDGRQTGVINALNERTTTGYDAAGNVKETVDARGNWTTFLYDDANRRIVTIDALNGRETVAYNALGNVVNTYDQLNNRTTFVYDDLNRNTVVIDAASGRMTTVYDAASQVSAVVDQLGNRTSYLYDAAGRQYVTIDALSNHTSSTFDAVGNLIEQQDALGNTWKTTYDALNRVIRQEDPLGNASTTVYDAVGNVTVNIDARGNRTTSTYDAVNRRTVVQDAVGGLTTTSYDANGNAVTVTNARNYTTTIAYDALNRTSAVTDALSHTNTTIYDAAGNVQVTVDAESNRTTYGYDALNRQVTMQKPSGGVWTTVYDAASNVVNTIDPLSNKMTFVYDELNRQKKVIDANGDTTTYLYDAAGNRTGIIDASSNRTTFVYDALNRESVQIDALGKRTTAVYDAVGQLTSVEDALGRKRNSFYDDAGRKVMERWTNPDTVDSNLLVYSYDANGNVLTAGDNNGTYTFSYDALNRKTVQQGPYGVTMTATYDAVGNRTVLQDSLGSLQTATYNAVDRVETLKFTDANGTVRADYTYTARDQVQTITRYSNLAATVTVGKTSYVYDATGRVQNIHHYDGSNNNLGNWTYAYNTADQLTTITEDSTAKTYSYDSTSQLTNDNGTTYSYDHTGNRNYGSYTVGSGNRITNDGTWTYTYDAVGAMTKKSKGASAETWTNSYDHRNQLTRSQKRATDGGTLQQQTDYVTDVYGNLIEEKLSVSGSSTTRHVYWITDTADIGFSQAVHELIADLDSGNALTVHYLSATGQTTPLVRVQASAIGWLLIDHQGSVRKIVDSVGAVVKAIVYDAWGAIQSETGSGDKGSLLFCGYRWDANTSEDVAKWRRLNLQTGQWTTVDPIGFAAGDVNTRRCVGNIPLIGSDVTGLEGVPPGGWDYWLKPRDPDPVKDRENFAKAQGLPVVRPIGGPYTASLVFSNGPFIAFYTESWTEEERKIAHTAIYNACVMVERAHEALEFYWPEIAEQHKHSASLMHLLGDPLFQPGGVGHGPRREYYLEKTQQFLAAMKQEQRIRIYVDWWETGETAGSFDPITGNIYFKRMFFNGKLVDRDEIALHEFGRKFADQLAPDNSREAGDVYQWNDVVRILSKNLDEYKRSRADLLREAISNAIRRREAREAAAAQAAEIRQAPRWQHIPR